MKSCSADIFNQNKWTAHTLKVDAVSFEMVLGRGSLISHSRNEKHIILCLFIYILFCLEK